MDDLVTLFASRLDGAGIESMVTGGVASTVYGEPRATRDLDLVVALDEPKLAAFAAAFPRSEFGYPSEAALTIECRRELFGRVLVSHDASGARADLWIVGRDPLHAWAMARRSRMPAGSGSPWVAPIEYVIVRKLEWSRSGASGPHLDDIRAMLRCSPDAIDAAELGSWIASRGLAREWSALVESC